MNDKMRDIRKYGDELNNVIKSQRDTGYRLEVMERLGLRLLVHRDETSNTGFYLSADEFAAVVRPFLPEIMKLAVSQRRDKLSKLKQDLAREASEILSELLESGTPADAQVELLLGKFVKEEEVEKKP
jgi:hypothetical protein